VSYNNREQPDASLLDLRLSTQMLTKQLEELQQLRDRVNRAEARAVAGRRGKHLGRLYQTS
jgi:tRNA A37 methylthiotransferase MiaB